MGEHSDFKRCYRDKMKPSHLFTLVLFSYTLSAQAQFDFQRCENIHLDFAKTWNSSPTPESEIIKAQDSLCSDQLSADFHARFLSVNPLNYVKQGLSKNISILEYESLRQIYSDLRNNPYFPHELIETQGCFNRASMIAIFLDAQGISLGQIIAEGNLSVFGSVSKKMVTWDLHTAVYAWSKINGKLQKIVIDPSLSAEPLTVEQWKDLLQSAAQTKRIKITYIESELVRARFFNNQKKLIRKVSTMMIKDLSDLIENADPLPERMTQEHLIPMLEFSQYIMRKKINVH